VENVYIESFNGKFRDECLKEHWFVTMAHPRRVIEYNTERPHSSLVAAERCFETVSIRLRFSR